MCLPPLPATPTPCSGRPTVEPATARARRLFDAVNRRAAARRARQATAEPPAVPPVPGDRRLRCRACGREEWRSADQLRRLVRGGWPDCCGRPMPPADTTQAHSEPLPAEHSDPTDRPWRCRPGARAAVRRGLLGTGPDLSLELLEVAAAGVWVRLAGPATRREEMEVALWSAGAGRAVRLPAAAESCDPAPDGSFVAEIRFRRPLTTEALAAFS